MDMAVGIADPDVILPAHLIQYLVSVTAIRVMYVILELFYYEPINEFDERSFI